MFGWLVNSSQQSIPKVSTVAKRTSPHKTFRSLWSAALVSNLGTLVEGVAAAWLMTSIATSPGMVALVAV
ncbi:MFS transporter [Mesorhizobium sp. M0239]